MQFCIKFRFCISTKSCEIEHGSKILSGLENDPNEEIVLKIQEDITVKPVEVIIGTTDIAFEEPVFNTNDDLIENPEQEIWQRKADVRNTRSSQPPVITIAFYYNIDLPKEPSKVDMARFNKASRLLREQNFDPTLLNFKGDMLGLPFGDQVLINVARYIHYFRNQKRIIFNDDILYRQYYNRVGDLSHLHVPLTVQLLAPRLKSLHGTAS